jgi:hypothetical protein
LAFNFFQANVLAVHHEFDVGIREKAHLFPNFQGDRHLPFRCNSHKTLLITLTRIIITIRDKKSNRFAKLAIKSEIARKMLIKLQGRLGGFVHFAGRHSGPPLQYFVCFRLSRVGH